MKMRLIVLAFVLCALMCGCGSASQDAPITKPGAEPAIPEAPDTPVDILGPVDEFSSEEPLICAAETRAEAEAIAAQYGIELVSFDYGVASFYTQEDPRAVIERGLENGWPELELNRTSHFD